MPGRTEITKEDMMNIDPSWPDGFAIAWILQERGFPVTGTATPKFDFVNNSIRTWDDPMTGNKIFEWKEK